MDNKFGCAVCDITLSTKTSLNRHKKTKHDNNGYIKYLCSKCGKSFNFQYKLKNHEQPCSKTYSCGKYNHIFK